MTKKILFLCTIVLLCPAIILFSQSRIPNEADNYLQVVGKPFDGGQDLVNVVFFEVPDTITSVLYFAIRDPEGNTTSYPAIPETNTGVIQNTTYSLIGGPGTFSDTNSRLADFGIPAANHKIGTLLSEYEYSNSFTAVQGENSTGDGDWVYFPGVSPSQGEHIGNKYYFKVVVEGEYYIETANVLKNAYQLDISLDNTGDPTGISEVRSFSYSWLLCFQDRTGTTWEIYPFVPDNASGSIEFWNHDMDGINGNETAEAFYDDSAPVLPSNTVTISDNGGEAGGTVETSFTIGSEVNHTWKLVVTEGDGIIDVNTAEVWFENSVSGEVYRGYADFFDQDLLDPEDHITVDYEDGVAITGGSDSEKVTLQVSDSSNNPVPYSRMIYVQVSNPAQVNTVNGNSITATNAVYVTTDSNGIGTFRVISGSSGTITVTVTTNGGTAPGTDGGEADLSGTNETVDIIFSDDIPPEISSAANLTFTEGNAQDLAVITITDSALANINTTNDIYIRIPFGLNAFFDNGVAPGLSVLGGSGILGTVDFLNGIAPDFAKIRINVTGNFLDDENTEIEISGLRLTANNSASIGYLEASFDGDTTYDVIDSKFINIISANTTYIWDGETNANWNAGTNWVGDTAPPVPPASNYNVIIPYVATVFPIVNIDNVALNNLTIANGATLDIGAYNFTINGTLSNDGTLILDGVAGQTLTYTNDTDSGLIQYTGTTPSFNGGGTYYDLELAGTGTWTPGIPVTVNNSLTINGGNTLSMGANDLTVTSDISGAGTLNCASSTVTIGGDITIASYSATSGTTNVGGDWGITAFTDNSGTVMFNGTGTSVISGSSTFYDLTCTTSGKTIQFTAGLTQTVSNMFTMQGTSGNEIILRSTTTDTQWMLDVTNSTVSYVDVQDSDASSGSGIYAADSIDSGNNDNWGLFPAPTITSVVADDIDDGDTIFGAGDTITVTFDVDTTTPAAANTVAIDALFNFSESIGTAYTGNWQALNTFVITITNPGAATPSIGSLTLTLIEPNIVYNNAGGTLSATGTSPAITGDWGTGAAVPPTIQSSYTEDTNGNGKIDRIVVQVDSVIGLNDDYDGITINVTGYTVADVNTGGTGGDTVFHIDLAEGPDLDTDATPAWWIVSNTSLATALYVESASGPTGESPNDGAPPFIAYTLAMADHDEVFVCFSEPVVQSPGNGIIDFGDFTYNGAATVTGRTRITTQGDGTEEVLLALSTNITADEVVDQQTITTAVLQDSAGLALVSQTHRVTDLGLGLDPLAGNCVAQPIWAQDYVAAQPGEMGYISLFDGSQSLRDQDITLQAFIHNNIPQAQANSFTLNLYFDVNVSNTYTQNNLWLPDFNTQAYNGLVPYPNATNPRLRTSTGEDYLRNFTIPADDSEITEDAQVEFLLEIQNANLYCARVDNPGAANWYRTITVWAFTIQDFVPQDNNVTIVNNVINPTLGETTCLYYIISRSGSVTVTVFDLKGDIVDVLYRGRRSSGEYSNSWDGRNRGGRIVARGVYFIKIVAPGINETRKVLVVK